MNEDMVREVPIEDFRKTGLLWFVNQQLHLFGMCIAVEYENGRAAKMFPARCRFRGFAEEVNDAGYLNVSRYLAENAEELMRECGPADEHDG